LTLTAPVSATLAGSISGSGGFTWNSGGRLTLSGSNSYSGGTVVAAGSIVGTTDSLQGTITNNAAVEFTQTASGTYASTMSGSGSLTKTGTGTVILAGANTYSGSTTISAGTLQVGNGGTAGALGGSGSIANAGTLAFNRSDAITLSRAITGTGSLVQQGPGNLILSATSTFTGPTSVNAGRLSVNGALGNTAVTVQSGGELGGSGSIVGALAILSGGTLSPGNSIASLSGGATSFAAGAIFGYEVDSSLLGSLGTAADLLVVSGNLDIASGALLSFADITSGTVQPFVEDTTIFAMINYSGAWNGGLFTYNGSPLADGSRFSVGSQLWEIDYNYAYDTASPTTIQPLNFQGDYLPSSGTQTFVAITAVPEPSTLALLGIGGVLAAWAASRRRR
jgi:autotransporter-associated beta strand protein